MKVRMDALGHVHGTGVLSCYSSCSRRISADSNSSCPEAGMSSREMRGQGKAGPRKAGPEENEEDPWQGYPIVPRASRNGVLSVSRVCVPELLASC